MEDEVIAALKPDEPELPDAAGIEFDFELSLVGDDPVVTVLDVRGPDSEIREEVAGEPLELIIREVDSFKSEIILPDVAADDTPVAVDDPETVGFLPNPIASQHEL